MSFSPAQVPEVAAGYWWDAELGVTGLGTSGFNWAEQNGHSSFDEIQSDPTKQPTYITTAGHQQLHFATGTLAFTAGTVQAGWTGAAYVAGWWRFPNYPTTGGLQTSLLYHNGFTSQRRIFINTIVGTSDLLPVLQVSLSVNGSASTTTLGVVLPNPGSFHFIECFIDPGAPVGARRGFLVDGVAPVPHNSVSDSTFTSLFDANTLVGMGGRAALASGIEMDVGWCVYAQGIPSASDRAALRQYKSGTSRPHALATVSGARGTATARDASAALAQSRTRSSTEER